MENGLYRILFFLGEKPIEPRISLKEQRGLNAYSIEYWIAFDKPFSIEKSKKRQKRYW